MTHISNTANPPGPKPGPQLIFSDVEKKPDGTVTFTVTVPLSLISAAYSKALSEAVGQTEMKGFRKGKAPPQEVEKQLGKTKLYTEALKKMLPSIYSQSIAELGITPISSPRVETKSLEDGKDWVLSITTAQKPEFELREYRKTVSAVRSASKIWVPGKGEAATPRGHPKTDREASAQTTTDEKLAKIFDALLTSVKLEVPEFLIEEEVNHKLSHLVSQLEKLSLTVEQYLSSLGKTVDELRDQYRTQARDTLKLELILDAIATDMHISVSDKEIDDLIHKVGDQKLRGQLDTPGERGGIRTTLKKRKVIDALMRI